MINREHIITHYIDAYNAMDVAAMVEHLTDDVTFLNVTNGNIGMELNGKEAFEAQANQTLDIFAERRQTITGFQHHGDMTEATIEYYAVLAVDLPDVAKKGDEFRLGGRSEFTFRGDQICKIVDIS